MPLYMMPNKELPGIVYGIAQLASTLRNFG